MAGELWTVFHEIGHLVAPTLRIASRSAQKLHMQAQMAAEFATKLGYADELAHSWAIEVEADLTAADLLIVGYASRFSRTGMSRQDTLSQACLEVAGGIAAALEAMSRIAQARYVGECESEPPSHPPLPTRWQILSNFIEQRVDGNRRPELLDLANLIGNISETTLEIS